MVDKGNKEVPQGPPGADVTCVGRGEAPPMSVDISVLPEHRFKKSTLDGDVTGVSSIGDLTVVICRKDGYSKMVAFDQYANRVDINLDPLVNDLLNQTDSSWISWKRGNADFVGHLAEKAGYPP